jgi:hypothetical protein
MCVSHYLMARPLMPLFAIQCKLVEKSAIFCEALRG